jgi:hypothetical protein
MLAVVKPSPLRLWGFLLTVIGGAALAFGSISDWAAVSLGGSDEGAVATKGIDLWQGTVTLALGTLIVVAILALRFVRPERRTALAASITAMGLAALGIAVWCVSSLEAVVTDNGVDTLVDTVVTQLGIAESEARRLVEQALGTAGVEIQARAGLWVVLVGAVLATIGGLVDLAWVRRKRELGDAIDADTHAEPERSTDHAGGHLEPDEPEPAP